MVSRPLGMTPLSDQFTVRLVLCLQLAMSRNIVWVLEQPEHSLLIRQKRIEWLANKVAYVP